MVPEIDLQIGQDTGPAPYRNAERAVDRSSYPPPARWFSPMIRCASAFASVAVRYPPFKYRSATAATAATPIGSACSSSILKRGW
jgi:hypothetical protein